MRTRAAGVDVVQVVCGLEQLSQTSVLSKASKERSDTVGASSRHVDWQAPKTSRGGTLLSIWEAHLCQEQHNGQVDITCEKSRRAASLMRGQGWDEEVILHELTRRCRLETHYQ